MIKAIENWLRGIIRDELQRHHTEDRELWAAPAYRAEMFVEVAVEDDGGYAATRIAPLLPNAIQWVAGMWFDIGEDAEQVVDVRIESSGYTRLFFRFMAITAEDKALMEAEGWEFERVGRSRKKDIA